MIACSENLGRLFCDDRTQVCTTQFAAKLQYRFIGRTPSASGINYEQKILFTQAAYGAHVSAQIYLPLQRATRLGGGLLDRTQRPVLPIFLHCVLTWSGNTTGVLRLMSISFSIGSTLAKNNLIKLSYRMVEKFVRTSQVQNVTRAY